MSETQKRPMQATEKGANHNATPHNSPDKRNGELLESSSSSLDDSPETTLSSRRANTADASHDETGSASSVEREEQDDDGTKLLLSELLPAGHELKDIIERVDSLGKCAEKVHGGAEESSSIWPDVRTQLENLHVRLLRVAGAPLQRQVLPVAESPVAVSNGDLERKRKRQRLIEDCLRLGTLITIDSIFDAVNDRDPMPGIFRDHNVQAAGLLSLESLLGAESNARSVLVWILCIIAPHCKGQLFLWEKRYIPMMPKACLPDMLDEYTDERRQTSWSRTLDQVKRRMKDILFLPFVHEQQLVEFWQHMVESTPGSAIDDRSDGGSDGGGN